MTTSIIPQTYQEWRHCITVDCELELTPSYIEKRLTALQNEKEHYTHQFIRLYGHDYLQVVIGWFQQAQKAA